MLRQQVVRVAPIWRSGTGGTGFFLNPMNSLSHKFSVAPMMDWTDSPCRVLQRCLTRHALLYTEMVTAEAVLHGDRARLLSFDAVEHPVALQLRGSDPEKWSEVAMLAAGFGY